MFLSQTERRNGGRQRPYFPDLYALGTAAGPLPLKA